jgi:hypothetical protein
MSGEPEEVTLQESTNEKSDPEKDRLVELSDIINRYRELEKVLDRVLDRIRSRRKTPRE